MSFARKETNPPLELTFQSIREPRVPKGSQRHQKQRICAEAAAHHFSETQVLLPHWHSNM